MLRGHQTYLSLFDQHPAKNPEPAKPERKGRSEVLHLNRNATLIHRYYYYVKLKGRNYVDVLSILECEFFISQRTIIDAIDDNAKLLKELNAARPDLSFFKVKYPHLTW